MVAPSPQSSMTVPAGKHGSANNNNANNTMAWLTLSRLMDAFLSFFGFGGGADDEDQFVPRIFVIALLTLIFAGIVVASFSCGSMWKIFRQKSASARMALRDKRK
jgi:hypothetical protein